MKIKMKKDKRGIALNTLAKWIIALAVLVIILLAIMILRGKGESLIERFLNLFKYKI